MTPKQQDEFAREFNRRYDRGDSDARLTLWAALFGIRIGFFSLANDPFVWASLAALCVLLAITETLKALS